MIIIMKIIEDVKNTKNFLTGEFLILFVVLATT